MNTIARSISPMRSMRTYENYNSGMVFLTQYDVR